MSKVTLAFIILFVIILAVTAFVYLSDKERTIFINTHSSDASKENPAIARQLTWDDIRLTDHTQYNDDGSCVAEHNGMRVYLPKCTANTMSGKNIVQEAIFTTNRTEGTTYLFVYSGQLESARLYLWRNYSHTWTDYVETDDWVNNYLVTDVNSYTDLGTPDSRCQVGNNHNNFMYSVNRYGNGTTIIYCFSSRTVVNATAFRISGNRTISALQQVSGYRFDYDDISNVVEDITNNIPSQLKKNFSFYKINDVNPGEYKVKWVFTPKDQSKEGKFHILTYPTSKGIVDSYQDNDYMYQDPAWNSSFSDKLMAYYTFDNSSSSTTMTSDSVGTFPVTGYVVNAVPGFNCLIGQCYYYDGSGDYINIGQDPSIRPLYNYTINLWIKPTEATNPLGIFARHTLANRDLKLWYGDGASNPGTKHEVFVAGTPGSIIVTGSVKRTNNWTMLTIVHNGTRISLYENGTYMASAATNFTISTAQNSSFSWDCSAFGGSCQMFEGYIDEAAIWNRTLNVNELVDLYNGGLGLQYSATPPGDSIYPTFSSETTTTNGTLYSPGLSFTFTINILNSNGTAGIEFNGVNYTLTNTSTTYTKTFTDLPAGVFNYYYWAYGNGTSNNLNKSATGKYTIVQSPTIATLRLNGTIANLNLTYPSRVNASASCTNTTLNLTRNGLEVTSQNNAFQDLKVAYYNFTATCPGNNNYTSNVTTYFANITQGTGLVYAYINNVRGNSSVTNGTTVWLNATLQTGSGTIQLYNNWTLINSGTSPIGNSTSYSSFGNYTILANYTGNENYTADSEEWNLEVKEAGSLEVLLNDPTNYYATNVSTQTFNWSIVPMNLNITNWTWTIWNVTQDAINVTKDSSYLCYQETTNASTTGDGNCLLNYTGTYSQTNALSHWGDVIDGNWNTSSYFGAVATAYIYSNYTFPHQQVVGIVWQVKEGNYTSGINITNYTLPSTCVNSTKGNIQLILESRNAPGNILGSGYCLNETKGWQRVFSNFEYTGAFGQFYEEAVIWNVSYYTDTSIDVIKTITLQDGNYTWGVTACGNDSAGEGICTSSNNRSLFIDATPPRISISYPSGDIGLLYNGKNVSLNFSASDINLDSCSYMYNGITTVTPCNQNTTISLSTNLTLNMTVNDTYGNSFKNSSTFNYIILENSQIYNLTAEELSTQNFKINLTFNYSKYPGIAANLIYNGTSYTGTQIGSGDNVEFYRTIDVPPASTKNLYWEIAITNGSGTFYYNSSVKTQTLTGIGIFFCNSTINDTAVNFTLYNQRALTTKINGSFYITFNYWTGSGAYKGNRTFQDINNNESSFKFCISPSNITYRVDADIKFNAPGFSDNYHYYRNVTFNTTIIEQPLYLLNSSLATVTELRVVDSYQNGLPNKLIQIQYYDIGTGTYYLVGMAKTNYEGKDLAYLNWYDTLYKFIGTDESGNVIFNYNPYKVGSTPQIFRLGSDIVFDFDEYFNVQVALYYNNVTKNVVATFIDPSGRITDGCLRIVNPSTTSYSTIYDNCVASTSGTLTYNMGNVTGNYIATFYYRGSFGDLKSIQFAIDIANEIYDTLNKKDSAAYAFLIVGASAFVGLFSPVAAIIMGLVGWIAASSLGFIKLNIMQTTAFIGVALVGIYLAWKLRT